MISFVYLYVYRYDTVPIRRKFVEAEGGGGRRRETSHPHHEFVQGGEGIVKQGDRLEGGVLYRVGEEVLTALVTGRLHAHLG